MTSLNRFYYISGGMLVSGGAIGSFIGYKWLRFSISTLFVQAELSTGQFFLSFILPYILLLAGVASVSFGLIMLVRGYTLRDRLSAGR